MKSEIRSVISDSLRPHRLYSTCNSLGQNTGVGSLSLLQGIIPTEGQTWISCIAVGFFYQLNHKGNPKNIEVGENESEVAQSCPTLCNPMDCSLQGSSLHGILQARILEWIAYPFSRGSSDPGVDQGLLHCREIVYQLSYQGSSGRIWVKGK